MKIIPLSSIEVRKRQRSSIASGPLNELVESILGRGLLHPPVCWFDAATEKWVLCAGERRLTAIQKIQTLKPYREFTCGTETIPEGHIPVTPLGDYLDAAGRFEAELDENIHRVDLDWPDRMRALASLHDMRVQQNPKQTLADTGRELFEKGITKVSPETQRPSDAGAKQIQRAQVIVQHLSNPKVAAARNATEALQLIYKQEEERLQAALIKRRLATQSTKPQLEVRSGDLLTLLPSMDPGTFDLIIADPPYGIDATGAGFRARTIHHHNYDDDPATARSVAQCILTEGFRLTKSRANCFIFCDIDMFEWLKRTSANMGWTPFRRPFIWVKSESEGLAPWGGQGPRITTEFIFYATKGQRGLTASPIDVFNVKRVPRQERLHAAEKPVELLKQLIECSTLPGESVLDPCCGSGSTLVACRESQRTGLGIEKDPDYFNTAMANVHSSLSTEQRG